MYCVHVFWFPCINLSMYSDSHVSNYSYQSFHVFWFPRINLFMTDPLKQRKWGKCTHFHSISDDFSDSLVCWSIYSCILIPLYSEWSSIPCVGVEDTCIRTWEYIVLRTHVSEHENTFVENTGTYVFSCSDTCILWEYMYSDTSILNTWDPMCWEYMYQNTSEYKDRSILCPMYWIHGSLLWIHGSLLKIHVSLLFICGPLLWMYGSLLWIHGSLLRMHVSLLWIHVSLSLICGPLLRMYRSLLWIHGSLLWCKGRCIIPRLLARNFLCEPFW